MKTLYILRHADADWGPKGSKDFDRSISDAGQEQCLKVADYIEQNEIKPDLILCSPAKRAIETCIRVKKALKNTWAVKEIEALYLCNSKQLIDEIQLVNDSCSHLLIIGHNPALQEVSWLLSSKSDSALMHDIEKSFPPATLTTHSFDANHWSQVDKGCGILKAVFKVSGAIL